MRTELNIAVRRSITLALLVAGATVLTIVWLGRGQQGHERAIRAWDDVHAFPFSQIDEFATSVWRGKGEGATWLLRRYVAEGCAPSDAVRDHKRRVALVVRVIESTPEDKMTREYLELLVALLHDNAEGEYSYWKRAGLLHGRHVSAATQPVGDASRGVLLRVVDPGGLRYTQEDWNAAVERFIDARRAPP